MKHVQTSVVEIPSQLFIRGEEEGVNVTLVLLVGLLYYSSGSVSSSTGLALVLER
jgi:hypothetical protein